MEEGSLRCDANVSVRLKGATQLGTRVEVKNLNSIKHLRHAVELEIDRLIELTEKGIDIIQETRSYNADKGITFAIRTKEDAEDYRYFPEPDLAPFTFDDSFVEGLQKTIPELPSLRSIRYKNEYGLSDYDALQLTEEKELSDLYDTLVEATTHKKLLANFLIGPVRSHLSEYDLNWTAVKIAIENWYKLLDLVADGKVGFSVAVQKLLSAMLKDNSIDPFVLALELDLIQDAKQDEIKNWVLQVLQNMPDKVEEYKKGKKGLMGLFIGEVKKISKGKADPQKTTTLFNEYLNN
jgi:aspartyl-tRNA(Asn)/glutamyl-tRNA(Gln) amidotransferase subunit B